MSTPPPQSRGLSDLVALFERLLGPDGCAWDRERTLEDLGRYLREECDEVVAAIDAVENGDGDPDMLREECGDLLANVVFTVQLAKARGWFTMDDVAGGAWEKLVRRHPHVFGDAEADTPEEVEALWQKVKTEERAAKEANRPPETA